MLGEEDRWKRTIYPFIHSFIKTLANSFIYSTIHHFILSSIHFVIDIFLPPFLPPSFHSFCHPQIICLFNQWMINNTSTISKLLRISPAVHGAFSKLMNHIIHYFALEVRVVLPVIYKLVGTASWKHLRKNTNMWWIVRTHQIKITTSSWFQLSNKNSSADLTGQFDWPTRKNLAGFTIQHPYISIMSSKDNVEQSITIDISYSDTWCGGSRYSTFPYLTPDIYMI